MNQLKETVGVVGAGIVGICTALYLQREGYKVTVIDRQEVAQGCSKGNAGHFATEQVFPLADVALLPQVPQMLFDPHGPFRIRLRYLLRAIPWFTRFLLNMRRTRFRAHKEALKSLNQKALSAYTPLLSTQALKNLIEYKGSLLTFEQTPKAEVKKIKSLFAAEGVAVDLLSGTQARALEPSLSESVTSALFFKEVAHTANPEQFCQLLADEFCLAGGEILKQEVNAIQSSERDITVLFNAGEQAFSKLIIATGAWSKKLIKPLGYKLPLDTERGYHLNLRQPNPISRPVASAERKFIMTPMSNGLRLAGTVEFAGLDAEMDPRRAEVLLPQAKELLTRLPDTNGQDDDIWMGMRPSLPDSLPVIGKAPKHSRLYFAFGHQHLGLTQGAITGQLISELLAGRATSVDIKPFCISRFGN